MSNEPQTRSSCSDIKLALILFADIVGYSQNEELVLQSQFEDLLHIINKLLSDKSIPQKDYLLKSTGDGILLINLNYNENRNSFDMLEIAINLQKSLKEKNIKIRQGIHLGNIALYDDGFVRDAVGNCINTCQRVMDFGDSDHILLSSEYKSSVLSTYANHRYCHAIGSLFDKHGNELQVYNYYCTESGAIIGNENKPCNVSLRNKYLANFARDGNWALFIKEGCKIVELSRAIYETVPKDVSIGKTKIIPGSQTSMGITFNVSRVEMSLNHGTHIDFPGHIGDAIIEHMPVGKYPLEQFVSEIVMFDATDIVKNFHKTLSFTDKNRSAIKFRNGDSSFYDQFFENLSKMKITKQEFITQTKGIEIENKVVLIYTGLNEYLKYSSVNPPERDVYHFNPFIETDLIEYFKLKKIKMLGTDALQIENPIINFENDHEMTTQRKDIIQKEIDSLKESSIHSKLLDEKILILENLNDMKELVGKKSLLICPPIRFMCKKCDDNSITRAFAIVLREGE